MPNGYIVYNTPTAFSVKNGRSQKKSWIGKKNPKWNDPNKNQDYLFNWNHCGSLFCDMSNKTRFLQSSKVAKKIERY